MTEARSGARRSRRGRPQVSSREEVAHTALRIARSEGLEGVTVRRIADELGHAPMTVYRITPTKAEVHELMVQEALGSLAFETHPDIPWREQITEALIGLYGTLRDNPAIIELFAGPHPIFGPSLDHTRESLLAVVSRGLPCRREAIDVINLLSSFVVGAATSEVARSRRSDHLEEHLRATGDAAQEWLRPMSDELVENALRALVDQVTRRQSTTP